MVNINLTHFVFANKEEADVSNSPSLTITQKSDSGSLRPLSKHWITYKIFGIVEYFLAHKITGSRLSQKSATWNDWAQSTIFSGYKPAEYVVHIPEYSIYYVCIVKGSLSKFTPPENRKLSLKEFFCIVSQIYVWVRNICLWHYVLLYYSSILLCLYLIKKWLIVGVVLGMYFSSFLHSFILAFFRKILKAK